MPCRLNAGSHAPSAAAITTGRYSGRQPAITALVAAFSTVRRPKFGAISRSEEHTSELQSQSNLVCRLLLEKKKKKYHTRYVIIIRLLNLDDIRIHSSYALYGTRPSLTLHHTLPASHPDCTARTQVSGLVVY